MKRFFSFLINSHQDILKYVLILLAIFLITNWYPKTGKFKYEFEEGKPWKYETYLAPFNFAIKKSDEELSLEKEKILTGFNPYYRIHSGVITGSKELYTSNFKREYKTLRTDNTALLKLKSLFKKKIDPKKDSLQNLQLGLDLLEDIYGYGIIDVDEAKSRIGPDGYINLLSKNIASKRTVSDFRTIAEVYIYIIDTLNNTPAEIIIPIIESAVTANILYDDSTTELLQNEKLANISVTRGLILEGQMVIAKGTIITKDKYQILHSLKDEYEQRIGSTQKGHIIFMGYLLLTAIIFVLLSLFLFLFAKEVFYSIRKLTFILLIIVVSTLLVSVVADSDKVFSLYAIPFCIVPIMVRTFFGSRLALFVHLCVVLISGFIASLGFNYPFLHLIAGIAAIYSNVQAYYWSQFVRSGAFILITYCFTYLGLSLTQEGSFESIEWANFGWLSLNASLTLLAYLLIPLFEKMFGFVSNITLTELADTNKPLLKELSLNTPGTFNHSLQVANLSEAAAYEIGANTILVRVGSLYHDIGKMENPLYFIENQITEVNPHDELLFEESARVIIGHVSKGIEKAKKHNLPDMVIDFIRTHHGTTKVEYFYQSYLKNFPEKDVDEQIFTYPGPLPYSRETAIVMMADSVEAASRSIKNPNFEDIDNLVEKIVNGQINQDQFINCGITFKEITVTKKIFKKMLKSIYHVRVAYPETK